MIYVDRRDHALLEMHLRWMALAILEADRRWLRDVKGHELRSFWEHMRMLPSSSYGGSTTSTITENSIVSVE